MQYYSLNGHPIKVSFKEAVTSSIAPDKGLFFPTVFPKISTNVAKHFTEFSREALAYEAIKQFVGDCIPENRLKQIIQETIAFNFPIVQIEENIHSLELFHGPTLAFKDVGARFMARCLGYFNETDNGKKTVLVATSGDTGGAVADGFYKVDGVDVIILYPKNKVSELQEKQLCCLGHNITAYAVEGTFDDCQSMVKEAFLDQEMKSKLGLVSANSINIARWLPQMFYYLFTLQKFANDKVVFSVPSGNFGNIAAGMMVKKIGFPIDHFIAANNENNVVHRYMQTEKYEPKPTIQTLSNAMDVGNPSNFVRIEKIIGSFVDLKNSLTTYSYSDEEMKESLLEAYQKYNYLMDTHGAIAYRGLKEYMTSLNNSVQGVFLETAHPAKFNTAIEPIINQIIDIPVNLQELMAAEVKQCSISADFKAFKKLLLK